VRWEGLGELADVPRVLVEVPRGGFVKRRPDGSTDFVAPLPCPYNYGSVLDTLAPDGDPLDALVLGPTLMRGEIVRVPLRAVFDFVDGGVADPKLVCSLAPLSDRDRRGVERFFAIYARFKQVLHLVRGGGRPTRAAGWRVPPT